MDFLPIFLDLKGRRCLVVGSGAAAAAKAALLRRAGADVAVVSRFTPALLDGAALVMVAGETLAVSEAVARAAQARGIAVNVMDEPALCSFLMPAIVDRSPVVLAIGTGGTAPLLAGLLRRWLEVLLPQRLGRLAMLAGCFRALVRRRLRDASARRRFWERTLTGAVAALALAGEDAAASAALRRALEETAHPPTHADAA